MAAQSAASNHNDITETFVRLYVFLAQSLDRCLDKAQRESFPEKEHQAFLADTRNKLMEVLRVNPVHVLRLNFAHNLGSIRYSP